MIFLAFCAKWTPWRASAKIPHPLLEPRAGAAGPRGARGLPPHAPRRARARGRARGPRGTRGPATCAGHARLGTDRHLPARRLPLGDRGRPHAEAPTGATLRDARRPADDGAARGGPEGQRAPTLGPALPAARRVARWRD